MGEGVRCESHLELSLNIDVCPASMFPQDSRVDERDERDNQCVIEAESSRASNCSPSVRDILCRYNLHARYAKLFEPQKGIRNIRPWMFRKLLWKTYETTVFALKES